MGAWGAKAFDNDTACDWTGKLERYQNLTYIEAAFNVVDAVGGEYLKADDACKALAACEVIARLLGNSGYQNPYTQKVDQWVAMHSQIPSTALIARADSIIERILGNNSELCELWNEGNDGKWHKAVEELRGRLST